MNEAIKLFNDVFRQYLYNNTIEVFSSNI